MGSRIRENPKRIFEVFVEIARPTDSDEKEPFILQVYPENYDDKELLATIPKFCFPCDFESPAVDHFTAVFTDIESKYRFGFCRHAAGAQTCLCIISFLPWYEIFYKLLNRLADILNRTDNNNIIPFLDAIYNSKVPVKSTSQTITAGPREEFHFECPDPQKLPSIPENRNLTEYYNAVDPANMMIMFASLLQERRILITSKKLSRLTACVAGASSLLRPMHWQHLYIPVLPSSLIDYCSAPMPYLIGIHSTLMEKARQMDLGDAVILDADKNTVETEHNDLAALPSEIVSSLKKRLRGQQADRMKNHMITGDGVARAFLKTLVALIGGYRDALKFRAGERIIFDPDAFLQSRSTSMQPLLEQMLQLQIFQQFINERLDLLNNGQGFTDEFEQEINLWTDRGGLSNSKYKEWLTVMKKQGKKLRSSGKDKWSEFTSKSKKAFKDFKLKIGELNKDDLTKGYSHPTTLTGPALKTERPPRPPAPLLRQSHSSSSLSRRKSSYENRGFNACLSEDESEEEMDFLTAQQYRGLRILRAKQYKVLNLEAVADDSVLPDSPKRISLDLLQDPDISNMLKKSYSMEDLIDSESEDSLIGDRDLYGKVSDSPRSSHSASGLIDYPIRPPRKKDSPMSNREGLTSDDSPMPTPPPRRATKKEVSDLIKLDSIDTVTDEHEEPQFDPLSQRHSVHMLAAKFEHLVESDEDDDLSNRIIRKPAYPTNKRASVQRHEAFRKGSLRDKGSVTSNSDSKDSCLTPDSDMRFEDTFDPFAELAKRNSSEKGDTPEPETYPIRRPTLEEKELNTTTSDAVLLKNWDMTFDEKASQGNQNRNDEQNNHSNKSEVLNKECMLTHRGSGDQQSSLTPVLKPSPVDSPVSPKPPGFTGETLKPNVAPPSPKTTQKHEGIDLSSLDVFSKDKLNSKPPSNTGNVINWTGNQTNVSSGGTDGKFPAPNYQPQYTTGVQGFLSTGSNPGYARGSPIKTTYSGPHGQRSSFIYTPQPYKSIPVTINSTLNTGVNTVPGYTSAAQNPMFNTQTSYSNPRPYGMHGLQPANQMQGYNPAIRPVQSGGFSQPSSTSQSVFGSASNMEKRPGSGSSQSGFSFTQPSNSTGILQPKKLGEKTEKDPFADLVVNLKTSELNPGAQKPSWEKFS